MSIQEADDRAQQRASEMFAAYFRAGLQWTQPEVDAYHNAERDLDWEKQRAEFDQLQAADHDMHYFPDATCAACQEESEALWSRMGRTY
jgi:hypothetical protein